MSSYIAKFKNKKTGEVVDIFCADDYFGKHRYGYAESINGNVMRENEFYRLYEPYKESADEND